MKITKLLAGFLLASMLGTLAVAQKNQPVPAMRSEFVYLVMQAVQDIDDLDPTVSDFAWELRRGQARKSATDLIRQAQNQAEFDIAGDAWDYLQNRITERIQTSAGINADTTRQDADRHRALALTHANIDRGRLYPHSHP